MPVEIHISPADVKSFFKYFAHLLYFRQTAARNALDDFAKPVEFPKRRVNVWRDANAGEFVVNYRRRKNFVF